MSEETLNLSRILDLSKPEDRQELATASQAVPSLRDLVRLYLDDYLTLFPEQHFKTLYSGGMMSIQGTGKGSYGSHIGHMLELTWSLLKLRHFEGFDALLAGFRNPEQFYSTMFEVKIAEWCATRQCTKELVFSPDVPVKGRRKRPDFFWHTDRGSLFCECKRGNEPHSRLARRLDRLNRKLDELHKQYGPWSDEHRLDLCLETPVNNRVEERMEEAVAAAAAVSLSPEEESTPITIGEVTAVIRPRSIKPPSRRGTMRIGTITVGQVATLLDSTSAHLTLSVSTIGQDLKLVTRLLQDARTQLPPEILCGVFLDIRLSPELDQKLKEIMVAPEYARTPWVGIWTGEEVGAYFRSGQPFDASLTVSATA